MKRFNVSKLIIQKQIVDDKVIIELTGSVDEDLDMSEVASLNQQEYIFDFKQVNMINSCGIREWINFITNLGDKVKIKYKNCPQIVIEQMNMVYGFIKDGVEIESFYAPYFCESCDEESKLYLETKMVLDNKAPIMKCPKCGENMEFDDIEEQYFAFLNRK